MALSKKRVGTQGSAQDNFLEPNSVTGLTATDVGTNRAFNNGAVNLSWSLPAASPPATSYDITGSPSIGTINTANTSYTITGLSSNVSYTFTVVAKNNAGSSTPASASPVTVTTVPGGVQNATATSTVTNQDTVTWNAPANNGGKSITSYTVVSSDGPSYPNSTSPKTIAETGNTTQNYTIYAINANGTGAGVLTNNVTTFTPPYFPPFFPPYFPPFFPPFFPPYFPPFFPPHFPPFFPPFFPPHFPPFFPPHFPPFFPPFFPPHFPPFFPPHFPPFFPPYFAGPFFPPYFFIRYGY